MNFGRNFIKNSRIYAFVFVFDYRRKFIDDNINICNVATAKAVRSQNFMKEGSYESKLTSQLPNKASGSLAQRVVSGDAAGRA